MERLRTSRVADSSPDENAGERERHCDAMVRTGREMTSLEGGRKRISNKQPKQGGELAEPASPHFWQEVLSTITAGNDFHGRFRAPSPEGFEQWFQISVSALANPAREDAFPDSALPQQKSAGGQLASQLRVLSAVSDGVAVFSQDGTVILSNPSLDDMLGYGAGELSGRAISIFSGDTSATGESQFTRKVMTSLRKHGAWQGDSRTRRKDGTQIWTNTSISKYGVPHHGTIWIAVVRDISSRKMLERELKHSKEQIELAMWGSSLGMWSVDIATGEVVCDARVFEIFGMTPEAGAMTRERWVSAIHPDDIDFASAVFRQHLKGETPIFQIEHRIKHPDGHYVWMLASGKVVHRTDDGWATRVIGTCQDVSIQKRLTQETENLLLRLESLLSAARGQKDNPPLRKTASDPAHQLTRREKAVLVLIAKGLTSTQIATRMHLAPATIGSHRRNLMAKLDLHSSAEVARFAWENGLLNGTD